MRNLSRAAYDTVVAGLVILTVIVSAAINVWYTHGAINTASHRWCTTLDLLTQHAPPRHFAGQYSLYVELKDLKHEFGCTER